MSGDCLIRASSQVIHKPVPWTNPDKPEYWTHVSLLMFPSWGQRPSLGVFLLGAMLYCINRLTKCCDFSYLFQWNPLLVLQRCWCYSFLTVLWSSHRAILFYMLLLTWCLFVVSKRAYSFLISHLALLNRVLNLFFFDTIVHIFYVVCCFVLCSLRWNLFMLIFISGLNSHSCSLSIVIQKWTGFRILNVYTGTEFTHLQVKLLVNNTISTYLHVIKFT